MLFLLLAFCLVQVSEAQTKKKGSSSKRKKKGSGKKSKGRKKKRRKGSGKGKAGAKKKKKKPLTKAQKKAELRKWKKKLRKLSPKQYQNLVKEHASSKKRIAKARKKAAKCKSILEEKGALITKYQAELGRLRKQVKTGQPGGGGGGGGVVNTEGITFRIQIGAYEQINLSQYANQQNFGVEQSGAAQKFTIGLFRSYREADSFKKYLQQMGVKDAWVVAYREGNRVKIEDVINQPAASPDK